MNHRTFHITFSLLSAASLSAFADDGTQALEPVVVTATRTETPLQQVGSSVSVITAEDIAHRQLNTVADVLRGVPGLDTVRSGAVGQTTTVFLRGAEGRHTLVLIDGVEMNDPGNPEGAFDFANLQTDQIERIEILRGGESSLYGSDAMGGVINIITKKGKGAPRLNASGQGGSYGTFRVGGGVSGGTDRVNYALDASHLETAGISAADRAFGNGERDGYKNTTVTGRAGFAATDTLDFDWTLRYNQANQRLDDCGGFSEFGTRCDDPNFRAATDQLFTRGQGRLRLFDGLWEQKLGMAYSLTDRRYVNPADRLHPLDLSTYDYTGEKIKVDWQNNLYLHKTNTLTFGIEDEEDRIHADTRSLSAFGPFSSVIPSRTANTSGYYALDRIDLFDRSFTTASVRHDDNNRFGGKTTWRVTQAFSIPETGTRIKGTYGTGFKAPTLNQLFSPPSVLGTFLIPNGNPKLQAETSRNWDIGLEQGFLDGTVRLGATYFHNEFGNLITYVTGQGYQNVSKAKSEGVESFIEAKPLDNLTLRGGYTYTRARNLVDGTDLIRRPRHKGSFDADYRIAERANLHLNILLVGERDDFNFGTFPTARVKLTGYTLVNLAGSYDLTKNIQLFARVDNLFDKRYEEVYGYGTYGVGGYGGVKLSY